jgi:hypothetical protein
MLVARRLPKWLDVICAAGAVAAIPFLILVSESFAAGVLGPVVRAESGTIYWISPGERAPGMPQPATALPELTPPASAAAAPPVLPAAKRAKDDAAFEVRTAGALLRQSVLKNCVTNPSSGAAPADVSGAVSATRIVVVTNVHIGIYNKATCALISRVALKNLFTSLGDLSSQVLFSPRVIYDPHSSRFFVTAISKRTDPNNDEQYLYFAVSTDATASAFVPFRRLFFSAFCKDDSPSFIDFASPGVSNNRWFVTANYYPRPIPGAKPIGKIMDIEKSPTLSGFTPQARCTFVRETARVTTSPATSNRQSSRTAALTRISWR